MKKFVVGLALAMLSVLPITANATIVPVGPQNDVAVSTVLSDWNWSVIYSSTYATPLGNDPVSTILAGHESDYIMLAAKRVGSSYFEVLAAASWADAIQNVGNGYNASHLANGAQWYYSPGYSWGFAGANDVVNRYSADTNGMNERDRLSWHTISYTGGWRAGSYASLNNDTSWEKYILVANDSAPVPEPSTLLLLGAGLVGLGFARKRFAKK